MDAFQTRRLRVRPLEPADEALYCGLHTDAVVMRHVGPPLSAEAARRGFSAARRANDAAAGSHRAAVLDLGTGEPVGLLALLQDPGDAASAEIGVMLLPPMHGRGFALELVRAVLARAFADGSGQGLGRVWARHAAGHAAAAALLVAAGLESGPPRGADSTWIATRARWRALHG